MKIVNVETISVTIPMVRPHKISSYTVSKKDFIIVKIMTNEGIVGVGESSLSPSFSGETQGSVRMAIDQFLKPVVLGRSPFDVERINEEFSKALRGNSFAKTAMDVAMYDVIGKKLDVPLYEVLGGKYRDKIPLSWSLGSADPELDIKEALRLIDEGFNIFKIKVGSLRPKEEIERVKSIRDAVGYGVDLRLDVNQGWTPEISIRTIKKMERNELGFIEQPVPWWDLDGMARVCKAVDTPIMADESLFTPHDALAIIKKEAADLFSLKLLKSGGFHNFKKIAAIAEAADIPCYVGCHIETSIGTAAATHAACSTRNVTYGCELFGRFMLKEDIVKNPVDVEAGFINVQDGPGLGIEVDEEKLNSRGCVKSD